MAHNWHYAIGGEKHGPITATRLKELVMSGQLSPDDLVWRDDMKEWRKASTVKGLFPDQPSARPPLAPKPTQKTPSLPSSNSDTATLIVTRKPKLTGYLHSVTVLIDGSSHGTIGGGFPSGVLDLLTSRENSLTFPISPGSHTVEVSGGRLKGSVTLRLNAGQQYSLTTYFSNLGALGGGLRLESQTSDVIETSPKKSHPSQNRRWTLKGLLRLGVVCFGILLLGLGAIRGCAESGATPNILLVKTGRLDAYPDVTVGQLVDNFLSNPRWSEGIGENRIKFVNARGMMTYNDKPVEGAIQFIIDGQQFELHAFEMNGIPQNDFYKEDLFEEMYDEYKK